MLPNKRKICATLWAGIMLVAAFYAGWKASRSAFGLVESKEAYFLRLDKDRLVCILRPSVMTLMFGPTWPDADIYCRTTSYKGKDSTAIIDGPFFSLNSLVLDYSNLEPRVEGGPKTVHMLLFSRRTRKVYSLEIDFMKGKIFIHDSGIANSKREVLLPSGAIVFR